MNDELERLAALDAVDREIERRRADRAKHTARATDAHTAMDGAARAQETADGALRQNRQEEHVLQRRLEDLKASRAAAMRVLTTGMGNIEVAERQLEKCDALTDEVETKMLELLEVQDTLVAAVEVSAVALGRARDVSDLRDTTTPQAIGEIDAAIVALEQQRPTLLAALPRELRTRYEGFRERGRHAVAHVKAGACEECRMEVGAQHLTDLKRGRLEPCHGCHRWLVLQ